MVGKQKEERVEFDEETRKKILKKTNYCCAACGEKLTMVKHTVDHIIPISRGGTNDIENLIGLCKMCNSYKANLVYYPGDYYTYLMMTNDKAIGELHDYVADYLKEEIHKLDLHRYPFISPCCTALGSLKGMRPKGYVRQLLFDIVYMRSDMRRANSGKVDFIKDYPYYAIIKRSTQKLFAILRIDYNTTAQDDDFGSGNIAQLTVFDEWSCCDVKILWPLMRNISEVLATRYIELKVPLQQICIASREKKIPLAIYDYCNDNGFGWFDKPVYICVANGTLNDREELGDIPFCCVDIRDEDTGVIRYGSKK